MIWTRPWALLLLLFPAGLFALYLAHFRWKDRLFRTLGDESILRRLTDPVTERHQRVKAAFALLASALLVAALAGPRWGRQFQEVHRRGSDVIVAVDVSLSMMAEDVKPNRLDRAKAELGLLIDELEGDRVGLVAFAGEAFLQCPLTLDYGAAKTLLDLIAPDLIPKPGTSLVAAIDTALGALPPARASGDAALVLLTDGEDHSGALPQALARAKAAGLRIFAVGIGTPQGEVIPLRDENGQITGYKKDKQGRTVASKLGEEDLRTLAAGTGGGYYRAVDGDISVDRIVADLRGLKKRELESRIYGRYEDRTVWPASLALVLLLLEFLWPERPTRWKDTMKNLIHNKRETAQVLMSLSSLRGLFGRSNPRGRT
jgi:Ca-activated chloride channel family protein